jgi:hypothetical protein
MQWRYRIAAPNGATDPDPLVTPATVPPARIVRLPSHSDPGDGGLTNALLLALDGVVGETITVDLYAIEDGTLPTDGIPVASTKFYRFATGIVVAHHVIRELAPESDDAVAEQVPPGGFIYVRITADTIAADREIVLTPVSR